MTGFHTKREAIGLINQSIDQSDSNQSQASYYTKHLRLVTTQSISQASYYAKYMN